jgi:hypothetical protein
MVPDVYAVMLARMDVNPDASSAMYTPGVVCVVVCVRAAVDH